MTKINEKLKKVQHELLKQNFDGWLFYDFRGTNDLACQFLEIPTEQILTRRFFYWVPSQGEIVKIIHAIEDPLSHLPGKQLRYRTWQEMEFHLASVLHKQKRILMEYSPRNAIPYISKIDAGTMDLVRELGVEVLSSCNLLQEYTSVWDDHKLQTHLFAAQILCQTVEKAWDLITNRIKENENITEYDVQQFILNEFSENQCETSDAPICAVNAHSANPHYSPSSQNSTLIKKGDFILIDLWCKQKIPNAVYADITRVGVAASKPLEKQQAIFNIVKKAQDAAAELVRQRFLSKKSLMGWEIDHLCRQVIIDAGYGEYFTHRTGHNIDIKDHGNGANIDNFETHDQRQILPGTCFSIEPGIYLPGEFGIRLEYDVYIHHDCQIQITGGVQEEIKCLYTQN